MSFTQELLKLPKNSHLRPHYLDTESHLQSQVMLVQQVMSLPLLRVILEGSIMRLWIW